jgi:hypothetical protein
MAIGDERLEAELRELGDWLDVPPAPDLRAAVRTRLAAPTPTRLASLTRLGSPAPVAALRRRARPRWVAALAAAVATVVVVAVPPARAAVSDAVTGLLRFAGVEVRRDGPRGLPRTPLPLPSAGPVTLDEARRAAHFPVRLPAALGAPEQVLVADPAPDGAPRIVSLLYRGGAVRVDEFDGRLDIRYVKVAADARFLEVGGEPAIWLPTAHPLFYTDRQGVLHEESARLAGPTLVWTRDGVTYRLEGIATLDEATAIARSVV